MNWKMSTKYATPAIPASPASPEQEPSRNSKNSGNSNQAVPADPAAAARRAALAVLFPERPWTGPPYPSGPCSTCGARHYVLPAGAVAWQCSDCHPPPADGARDTFTLSPTRHG